MNEELTEAKVAEAAHAAAVSHEATSNAREAQMHDTLVSALTEVMVAGERDNMPLLLRRVPFLCTSVELIKTTLEEQAKSTQKLENNQEAMLNDIKWLKWIGMGFVMTGGLLALKSLGV